ncbi:MAG: tRNA (adenosine(37)-N6)-dimethylallyltransferase MiaA [Paludibacteraceae bacterium]|nr:tRNA (adenosine(37)-N6)-dimethylallyltransferase MiaA [Paludibacteraceae bacterium]
MKKTLIVLCGATGVGKTELSISLAKYIGSPILNADSRQIYRELPIGTAAPTAQEQALVPHYFVGTKSVRDPYNAGMYERDAIALLDELFHSHDALVMAGGAMMYIDAVCQGLDNIPQTPAELRNRITQQYQELGLYWLQEEVKQYDPGYFATMADNRNPQRLIHALEVSMAAGQPYSSFRTATHKQRPFNIIKLELTRPREELYDRINRRVDMMLQDGLEDEAHRVYHLRHLNSLQTVGYKEMFDYFDGTINLNEATRLIKQNSRHYAKRQMTWFRRDNDICRIDLSSHEAWKQIKHKIDNI